MNAQIIPIYPHNSSEDAHKASALTQLEINTSHPLEPLFLQMAALPGVDRREGQELLAKAVYDAIEAKNALAAEAPTGVGKTIAYLLGTLGAAKSLWRKPPVIVVSTGTVTLQEQILRSDLPKLARAGLIDLQRVSLMKGRARYFCAAAAEAYIDRAQTTTQQADMFSEVPLASFLHQVDEVKKLLKDFKSKTWRGDRDSLEEEVPKVWNQVAAQSSSCTRSACPHYSVCPLYRDRRASADAEIIVANHDIVLADLMQRKEGLPLIPREDIIYVFDEAHHLPEAAIKYDTVEWRIEQENPIFEMSNETRLTIFNSHLMTDALAEEKIDYNALNIDLLTDLFNQIEIRCFDLEIAQLRRLKVKPSDMQIMFGRYFAEIKEIASPALLNWRKTVLVLRGLLKPNPEERDNFDKQIQFLIGQAGRIVAFLSEIMWNLDRLGDDDDRVMWISKAWDDCHTLHSAPLEGSKILEDVLWSTGFNVIMVSATLKTMGSFERFAEQVAAPSTLRTLEVPSNFPFEQSNLVFQDMANSPKDKGWTNEFAASFQEQFNAKEGTLILFNSYTTMKEAMAKMPETIRSIALIQGTQANSKLIKQHKQRIDAGQGSVLVGVASFAEGLDLPGNYCTHVVIARLPFGNPDDPITEERQARGGEDFFERELLPDVALKLVQMVGRLMRRESDRGRITVFDKRLWTTKFGNKLQACLPPFTIKRVYSDPMDYYKEFEV